MYCECIDGGYRCSFVVYMNVTVRDCVRRFAYMLDDD